MPRTLPEPSHVIADKYVIERCLGRGGMGAVYAVSHRVTGKKLALKCLLPEYLEQPEIVERFLREAQTAGRIQHRHVVDVFDVGRDDSVIYIVMPLLDGKPLSALLQDELTLEETLAILLRAMEGVAAAHAQGIVHRDLKPDNIFVCVGPSGRLDDPRVLDFGISKLDDDDGRHALTKSGVMMGTPHYMSFEQLNSQRDIDVRCDVYAMGVILYEALAGEPPYVADSAPALAIRMMSGPPQHLDQRRPDLPEGLADVVMKAVARERGERHQTVAELIEAVRPFVQGAGSVVPERQGRPLRASARQDSERNVEAIAADATLPARTPPAGTADPVELRGSSTPRLKLEDEAPPPRLTSLDPRHKRWAAAGAGALAALGLMLTAWLVSSSDSPAVDAAGSPAAPQVPAPLRPDPGEPAPARADEQAAPEESAANRTVRRKVKRKVRRKPIAKPGATTQPSAEADTVADEYEEYEDYEEVVPGEEGTFEEAPVTGAPAPAETVAEPLPAAAEAPSPPAPAVEAPPAPEPAPAEPAPAPAAEGAPAPDAPATP